MNACNEARVRIPEGDIARMTCKDRCLTKPAQGQTEHSCEPLAQHSSPRSLSLHFSKDRCPRKQAPGHIKPSEDPHTHYKESKDENDDGDDDAQLEEEREEEEYVTGEFKHR
jgi:hypothetical protein